MHKGQPPEVVQRGPKYLTWKQASYSNFCKDFHFFQHLRVSFRGDCGSYCFISDVKRIVKFEPDFGCDKNEILQNAFENTSVSKAQLVFPKINICCWKVIYHFSSWHLSATDIHVARQLTFFKISSSSITENVDDHDLKGKSWHIWFCK